MSDRLYNVGAYIRLSIENTAYDVESSSIENQQEMLSQFIAMMPGWVEREYYIDNGFSGATFQRPAFQKMMEDVRSGKINLVLVKDLSRFGRNYLEAGRYLEEELPTLGCRFVSLSEGVDTENGENDIIPFFNAMNDYYLKNLSDRIRSVMAAKARDGQKISGSPPYGYYRNPLETTRLLVDEYAADVVRKIFQMRSEGCGYGKIAKALNAENILPPKLHYLTAIGRETSSCGAQFWRNVMVGEIVHREIYIGNAVQLEKQVVSHRDKREILRSPEDRVRVDNAFPAIIDRETWEKVQAVNDRARVRYSNKRAPEKQLFSDLLFCQDCGKKLIYIRHLSKSKKGGAYIYYHCQTYGATGGDGCTRHPISERALIQLAGEKIRELAGRIRVDANAVRHALTEKLLGEQTASKAQRSKECRLLKSQLHKLRGMTSKLYEQRVSGTLSEENYRTLALQNEAERMGTEKRLALLESSEQERAAKMADIDLWMGLIRKHSKFSELTRDLLDRLIERIEVGERRLVDGAWQQDVRIVFRFVGLAYVTS